MKKIILIIFTISFLFGINCENKIFSLSTEGENGILLQDVITDLSDTCNLNIIIKDNVAKVKLKQTMQYVKLTDVTLKPLLKHILGENGLFYTLKDNTLIISGIETKNFKINYVTTSTQGETNFYASTKSADNENKENILTSTFNFDFWDEFSKNINDILKSQNNEYFTPPAPIIDKLSGIVTVTGTKSQIDKIAKYINDINNRLHKEVFVDVRIYSVTLSKTSQTGVNWSQFNLNMDTGNMPTRGISVGTTILSASRFHLAGLLNFLAEYGQVNSISNPKITTLNNQKAIITVGETINYSYKTASTDANGNIITSDNIGSQFVGMLLDITPQISDKNIIIMRINPSISSFKDENQLNDPTRTLPPDTIDKKLNTIVRVKDGDTIILGGLITDDKSLIVNGVPVLKDIPIIKYLFSSKSELSQRKELVFVITPHIINLDKKTTINKALALPKLGEF